MQSSVNFIHFSALYIKQIRFLKLFFCLRICIITLQALLGSTPPPWVEQGKFFSVFYLAISCLTDPCVNDVEAFHWMLPSTPSFKVFNSPRVLSNDLQCKLLSPTDQCPKHEKHMFLLFFPSVPLLIALCSLAFVRLSNYWSLTSKPQREEVWASLSNCCQGSEL